MNVQSSYLQIRVCSTDGTTRTFTQGDVDLAHQTLIKLNPTTLFNEDRITVPDRHSEAAFQASELTRIDLITDQLSVWDFPFLLGAPIELTEAEFSECTLDWARQNSPGWRNDIPVFLDITMTHGQRCFVWMEVIGGLPPTRLGRIYSLPNERRLIFGLRTGGVGILNLANMLHFSIFPEPPSATMESRVGHYSNEGKSQSHAYFVRKIERHT